MAKQSTRIPLTEPKATDGELAIGFIATGTNTDALLRSVIRAQSRGYDCIVAVTDDDRFEGRELVEAIGADVFVPDTLDVGVNGLRDRLARMARERSYLGIIFAPVDCDVIDYERTEATMAGTPQFGVEAVVHESHSPLETGGTMVGIPAYNEGSTIGDVVREVKPHVDTVLVVDDGSDDGTEETARSAGATVTTHESNKGYGATLKTTFRVAMNRGVDHLVVLDGDGQHDPSDIPSLVDEIERHDADVVIGSRFAGGATSSLPLYRLLGLKAINGLTNLSMGVIRSDSWVSDTQSGFRAYSARAVRSLARDDRIGDKMEASTDIIRHAHERDYDIREVGTTITYDVENASSHNPVSHGLTLVRNALQTVERERPVTVFGIPGVAFTLIGVGLVYLSFSIYISTETFPIGLVIAAVFCSLAGILACFTAIILHSLTLHFEDAMAMN